MSTRGVEVLILVHVCETRVASIGGRWVVQKFVVLF